MTDATAPRATRKPSPRVSSITKRRRRQAIWRDRRRARFEEAMALLQAIGDDDAITVVGKDYEEA